MAYNIEMYVQLEGGDTDELLREIEATIRYNAPEAKGLDKVRKVPHTTKTGNDILHGSMRELKTQVILHFEDINRRYKDPSHFGNTLLHFICQEVYLFFITYFGISVFSTLR